MVGSEVTEEKKEKKEGLKTTNQVYSSEVKKTEILNENFRRAIGLRIREMKEVYEGEVVEIVPVEIAGKRNEEKTKN